MLNNIDPVLLSLVRRAYPALVAQSIIGTQPIIGPAGNIFSLREQHRNRIIMNVELYKTFLRMNNRKRTFCAKDFIAAKYPMVKFNLSNDWIEMHKWCKRQYGEYGYVWCGNSVFFQNEEDAMLFRLAGWA